MTGVHHGLLGIGVEERLDRGQERRPVAAGEIHAAHRALKEDVAREQHSLFGYGVADVAGAVPGREADLEAQAGEVEPLPSGDRLVGGIALIRSESRPRDERHDVG